jgi:uncharacterized protein
MARATMQVEQTWDLEYRHAVGDAAQRFFEGIGRKALVGSRCPGCDRVLVPARSFCDRCHRSVTEFVEVELHGVLEAFTVVYAQFKNMPEPPYALGYVRSNGADTAFLGYIRDVDVHDRSTIGDVLHVGMPMDIKFTDPGSAEVPARASRDANLSDSPSGTVLDYWFVPGVADSGSR